MANHRNVETDDFCFHSTSLNCHVNYCHHISVTNVCQSVNCPPLGTSCS